MTSIAWPILRSGISQLEDTDYGGDGSASQEYRPGREGVGLDRLEPDPVLNLRERSLAGTQEDRPMQLSG